MILFLRDRLGSFKPAFAGIGHVFRSQPNAWIHAVVSLAVLGAGLWVQLSGGSWALILLAMALVWITEFLNTALEAVVDLASPAHSKLAQVAKDVSAAAVVIAAAAAVIVGLLILGPPVWARAVGLF
ncbi:MAG: diacylglycerol kinase family protein [Anaerolineales bacterium]